MARPNVSQQASSLARKKEVKVLMQVIVSKSYVY